MLITNFREKVKKIVICAYKQATSELFRLHHLKFQPQRGG